MQSTRQRVKDFLAFPLRAVAIFENDRWGLSSLRSERFEYCAAEVRGYCLDLGCGRGNRFITEYLGGNGLGVDVFPYEGLGPQNIVPDPSHLPYDDGTFDSVALIANLNHIPRPIRDAELAECFRVLKVGGGNIIVTMGAPGAELLAHLAVFLHDMVFKTRHDVDHERGMKADEEYFVREGEILNRLARAGFVNVTKRRFWTQWWLNAIYVGWKARGPHE